MNPEHHNETQNAPFSEEILATAYPQPPIFWTVRGIPMVQQCCVHGDIRLVDANGEIHHESTYDPDVKVGLP